LNRFNPAMKKFIPEMNHFKSGFNQFKSAQQTFNAALNPFKPRRKGFAEMMNARNRAFRLLTNPRFSGGSCFLKPSQTTGNTG
jgi:hypothetical protein